MGLLGYTITKESELDKTAYARVEADVIKSKEYTEHVADIRFVDEDRDSESIVFDRLKTRDDKVVFYEYSGVSNRTGYGPKFKHEKLEEIPYEELKDVETVERNTRRMEYEDTEKRKKPVEKIKKGEKVLEVYYK